MTASKRIDLIAELLLRRGRAPREVRRLRRELMDHLDDLSRAGRDPAHLGSVSTIVRAAEHTLPTSTLRAHPLTSFGLIPPLLLAAATSAQIGLVVAATRVFGATWERPDSMSAFAEGLVIANAALLSLTFAMLAYRSRSAWHGPTITALLLAGPALASRLEITTHAGGSTLALRSAVPWVSLAAFAPLVVFAMRRHRVRSTGSSA